MARTHADTFFVRENLSLLVQVDGFGDEAHPQVHRGSKPASRTTGELRSRKGVSI